MAYEIELTDNVIDRTVFVDTKDTDTAIKLAKEEYPGWQIVAVCEVIDGQW